MYWLINLNNQLTTPTFKYDLTAALHMPTLASRSPSDFNNKKLIYILKAFLNCPIVPPEGCGFLGPYQSVLLVSRTLPICNNFRPFSLHCLLECNSQQHDPCLINGCGQWTEEHDIILITIATVLHNSLQWHSRYWSFDCHPLLININ